MFVRRLRHITLIFALIMSVMLGQGGLFLCFCHDEPSIGSCSCGVEAHTHSLDEHLCFDDCTSHEHAVARSHSSSEEKTNVPVTSHQDTCDHLWLDGLVFTQPDESGGTSLSDGLALLLSFQFFETPTGLSPPSLLLCTDTESPSSLINEGLPYFRGFLSPLLI